MKLTINKLIANDMINYGMDKTSSFNYIVSLNSYLEEYLLTQTEKIVYENAKRSNIELDFEDIRDIANDILDDDTFNDDITNHLKNYDKGQEL